MTKVISDIIQPETEIEKAIISDNDFINGMFWGTPRHGHPEGQIIFHIKQVLENVNKYSNSENREKLRLLALIHDSFKYKVDIKRPKSRDNNHAIFARKFAEKFFSDKELLDIIELHDEAYNSWKEGYRTGNWDLAEQRACNLITRMGSSINLYRLFYQCDNETGDKKSECYNWFTNLIGIFKV